MDVFFMSACRLQQQHVLKFLFNGSIRLAGLQTHYNVGALRVVGATIIYGSKKLKILIIVYRAL
jgi:hypothetical protein